MVEEVLVCHSIQVIGGHPRANFRLDGFEGSGGDFSGDANLLDVLCGVVVSVDSLPGLFSPDIFGRGDGRRHSPSRREGARNQHSLGVFWHPVSVEKQHHLDTGDRGWKEQGRVRR